MTTLLTPNEVAERLAVSVFTVRDWRTHGTGPAWIKVGKSIRYLPSDVDEWVAAQRQIPTQYPSISRMPAPKASTNSVVGAITQQDRLVCPACGTWVCASCGFKRSRASRIDGPQICSYCRSTTGKFLDTRHSDRATRDDHLDLFRNSQQ